jgi:hypothetical protein
MGVKLCCSDSRDKNPEPDMRRFETFGDIPAVPNVIQRVEDQEVNVDITECYIVKNDQSDNMYKRKRESKLIKNN